MIDRVLTRVRALVRRGETEYEHGDVDRAIRAFSKALRLLERTDPAAHAPFMVALLNRVAACQRQLGKFLDAGQSLQRALFLLLDHGLDETRYAADTFSQYAALEHAAGNWLRGEPFARQALRLRLRLFGPDDPRVAADQINLAALLERQGKLTVAARMYRKALRTLASASDGGGQAAAVAHSNLGAIAFATGDFRDARECYRRAQAIEDSIDGVNHAGAGYAAHNRALIEQALRRPREARALFSRAVSLFERHLGRTHPAYIRCLEHCATAMQAAGEGTTARRLARRAELRRSQIGTVCPSGVAVTGTINLQYARYRLSARPSAIHRLGVFAEEAIPAGRKVIEYTGERISQREAERRWTPSQSYLFDLDDHFQLDGALGGSGAEYINHSCAPNLRSRILRGHILYFSDRAISPGEELTVDYHYEADLDPIPCACGTPDCRGVMNVLPPKRRGTSGLQEPPLR